MQVSNTLNNSIRILFNPNVETFKLFDFLVVKSNEDRYIAEIIEIYDDKFDASQNVAKLKIFYKVNENNEVVPYDNFTPNKECEILKIKQDEIEKFINQDKDTFEFGKNVKNSEAFNLPYDFFNNNAVVLADKIENANAITSSLAQKLSKKKHTVIIDSTGIIEFEKAKKIKASKNFKMPFNFTTIDFIFDKCLSDASLEFQATGAQIINEIKKYAKKQESGFISFNAFTRVLLEQYKATPYPELKLLLARIKKHQMSEIFATNKKDYENLFKTINSNKITIIDLSGIEASWQKAYHEYIVEDLKDDVYLITRINDENCDVDLINNIYCKKKNITFVPNVSYNYKKLPSLMQYCKNYILMPSLYQRNDFLNANFALSNLISNGCIIFGEDTDDFLYLVKNYELIVQEEQKEHYRKIALSLMEDEEENLEQQLGQKGDYFENIQKEAAKKTDSEKLMEELTKYEKEQGGGDSSEDFEEVVNVEEAEEVKEDEEDIEEIENDQAMVDFFSDENETPETIEESEEDTETEETEEENVEENLEIVEEESSEELEDNIEEKTEDETSLKDEFQEINKEISFEELSKETEEKSIIETELDKDSLVLEEMEETEQLEIKESPKAAEDEPIDITINESEDGEAEKKKISPELEKFDMSEADLVDPDSISLEDLADSNESKETEASENKEDNSKSIGDIVEDSDDTLSDDELDVFELAESNKQEDSIDLDELANNSIDENFEEVVNSKPKETSQTIAVDKDINISADIIEKPATNSSLPIFKEEEKEKDDEMPVFKKGDIVIHPKYGRGTVIKTIKHEQRQLIHVDFEEADKKLLDPKVANIKLEQ